MGGELAHSVMIYLQQGGLVMIPLIICSTLMWTLILDRLIFFARLERRDLPLHGMVRILNQPHIPEYLQGIRAHLVRYLLSHQTHDPVVDRRIVEECAMGIRRRLNRFLAAIMVLAAVSPLFGLLGTVTGMITTFDVITLFGTGNARAMAGGISEALVTTQSGLMVSIPGLFMSVLLYRRAQRAQNRLNTAVMTLKRSIK